MSDPNKPLLFAPAGKSESSQFVDLDELFVDSYFPPDMDYTQFFADFDATTEKQDGDTLNPIPVSLSTGSLTDFGDPSMKALIPPSYSSASSSSSAPFSNNATIPLAATMATIPRSTNASNGVLLIPPSMPSLSVLNKIKSDRAMGKLDESGRSIPFSAHNRDGSDDDGEGDDDDFEDSTRKNKRPRKKLKSSVPFDPLNLTEKQKVERRERNREHAKRSRIRKKVLLDLLQDQLAEVRRENMALRRVVIEKIPENAAQILASCTTVESELLVDSDDEDAKLPAASGSHSAARPQQSCVLMEPDFRLIQALVTSQQNFVLSDPKLPDNPIVYCSDGFCKLSGYKRSEILGRNCRFLQGPGTDQNAVELIRAGVAEGRDMSVCLLNYKADGSPFWNQFFVAAIRDSNDKVVNFVGVQCEVNTPAISQIKARVKKLPIT